MVDEDWWPCEKRRPHRRHDITNTWNGIVSRPRRKQWAEYEVTCPGVRAHPDTQIGRDEPSPQVEIRKLGNHVGE